MMKESSEAKAMEMRYRLIERNVGIVEDVFALLEKKHGKVARIVLWELYVDGERQPEVAQKHGLTLRTMQRNAAMWMKDCLGGIYA